MPGQNNTAQAARLHGDFPWSYARAGVEVLPLHSIVDGKCTCSYRNTETCTPGKHPITSHGLKDATTDANTIQSWIDEYPWCNWGVRPPKGVLVLDFDPRNGGLETWNTLASTYGPLPSTLTALTGGLGFHVWLSYSGLSRGKLGHDHRGVDLKSNSGYLVAPPSVHESGRQYEWINQAPAAWMPMWLRDLVKPPTFKRVLTVADRNVSHLVKFVLESRVGERNRSVYWAACRAWQEGNDGMALLDAAVSIGLTEDESVKTIQSAYRATKGA